MPNKPLTNGNRILAIRLDNIGDIVMLSPALRNLKKALPQSHLALMASPAGSQVAPLLPWVDEVIPWRTIWQEVSDRLPQDPDREMAMFDLLRSHNFDAAIIFTSFSQSPWPPAYAAYLAGIPIRIGQSKEFGGALLTHTQVSPPDFVHQTDRNLALLELAGIEPGEKHLELQIPQSVPSKVDDLLAQTGIDLKSPFIVLAPGASASTRRYSSVCFAEVARQLVRRADLPMIIVGPEREKTKLASIVEAVGDGPIYSLMGQTSIPEFAELVRRAQVVIANNSAALHVGDAFRRPMVILYGGCEYISQWEPRFSPSRLLLREVECSPCFLFECPYGKECLDIPPEEVVEAALDLLLEQGELSTLKRN